jgi:hypothetical protein
MIIFSHIGAFKILVLIFVSTVLMLILTSIKERHRL